MKNYPSQRLSVSMKFYLIPLVFFLFVGRDVSAQQNPDTSILKTILVNYYKTEKAIYKGRNQLLFFYCEKSNNNEEIFETVNTLKLPSDAVRQIKKQVATDIAPETWAAELNEIYEVDKSNLKIKINSCLTLDEYQVKQKRFNLNNQRLMIVSKPVFYSNGNLALVKVVFYRSIEHNNGSVLLMEKSGDTWVIKELLNSWST